MRILGEDDDLGLIPDSQRRVPVRLPFRVDLRDFAVWLSKRNPFNADENATLPEYWAKTLEAFLAAQVRHQSGGTEFDVDDLLAVARISSLLFVFDGLDEVADIARRRDVVEEIVRGSTRIAENALSLQVIVTSRPAAFANSPGLPETDFPYFHLESLTRQGIEQYGDRWLKARRLSGRESSEFRHTLKEKLDQPHLRDLARNPMQLAILLSLLQRRGASLPDKRTALYDSYIDVFLGRESEKSPVVREHRDLLVELHQYLAWKLQIEAETGKNTGSISIDRLQYILKEYLSREEHDTSLVDKLFQGMVERVFALVSRVQGTLEFEVQPLREYFAARYLYETAPYSPAGNEKRGTLTERFDAIARNFYWLNVTRFLAGCFNKGELPALVERLFELSRDESFRRLSHPRILAATLLSDWVFSQNPRSMREVVALVLDGIGLRYVLSSTSRRIGRPPVSALVLPKKCGNEELIEKCISLLRSKPPRDYSLEIIDLLKANSTPEELAIRWTAELEYYLGKSRRRWFAHALLLGTLSIMPKSDLLSAIDSNPDPVSLLVVFRAKRGDVFEGDSRLQKDLTDYLLNSGHLPLLRFNSVMNSFFAAIDPTKYLEAFAAPRYIPVRHLLRSRRAGEPLGDLSLAPTTELEVRCDKITRTADHLIDLNCGVWTTSLGPWDELVELLRMEFGDCWKAFWLAHAASGIKSMTEIGSGAVDLFDSSISLCKRARYARMRAGMPAWWKRQFAKVESHIDRKFILALVLSWGSSTTIAQLEQELDNTLNAIPEADWQDIDIVLKHRPRERTSRSTLSAATLPGKLSPRLATALAHRVSTADRRLVYKRHLTSYNGTDPVVLDFCMEHALEIPSAETEWLPDLQMVRHAFLHGSISERYFFERLSRQIKRASLPIEIAEKIMDSADNYPGALMGHAENRIRQAIAEHIVPVGLIAEREGWFA